ncbi:MAG TPA: hypothetical protein VGP07_06075 [Polyangia bacterium]|jgi:hypothetical protein
MAFAMRVRRIVLSFVVVIVTLGVLAVVVLRWAARDDAPSLTTDTSSTQLLTSAARVAFLARYLKLRGPVTDAAFHIVWHDNSHGVPGPSDWSVVAALQVPPTDRTAWLADARPVTSPHSFARVPIPSAWNVHSAGATHVREGVWLIWHPEGVLEVSASTN